MTEEHKAARPANGDDRPLVSVVVPTYNRAHLIRATLESVLNQTLEDLELIVVDDRSTDGTAEVVRSIDDRRVVYLPNSHGKGAAGARNCGMEKARGRYVALLDSDDRFRRRKLELQVSVLESDPHLAAVGGGWQWVNRDSGAVRVLRIPDSSGRIEGLPRWFFNIIQDILFRSAVIRYFRFDQDLKTYENLDWLIRISKNGHRFGFLPDVLVDCYDHDGPRNSAAGVRRLETLARIVSRHEEFIRRDRSGWSVLNERLGAGFLVMDGKGGRARTHLFRSLKARPSHLRTWAYAAAATIPAGRAVLSVLRRTS